MSGGPAKKDGMTGGAGTAKKPGPGRKPGALPKGGRDEGRWGEALAAEYLRQRGYRLAAYSYQCRFGEIDLIAWDGDILCFVEVKTRTNTDMGLPREYVTPAKQKRLKKTAAGLPRPIRCGGGVCGQPLQPGERPHRISGKRL